MTLKPGSANRPFPGVVPRVLKEDGSPAGVNEGGYLVIEKPYSEMIREALTETLENKRVKRSILFRFKGKYLTGDERGLQAGDYWH